LAAYAAAWDGFRHGVVDLAPAVRPVLLTFGFGVAIYLLLWIFVPDELIEKKT
jgi:phage shock protein PspC (stress-responsive transcriptional regulator)